MFYREEKCFPTDTSVLFLVELVPSESHPIQPFPMEGTFQKAVS